MDQLDIPKQYISITSKQGLGILEGPPSYPPESYEDGGPYSIDIVSIESSDTNMQEWSVDGSRVGFVQEEIGYIARVKDGHMIDKVTLETKTPILAMYFSASGRYLLSWRRQEKDKLDHNLQIWNSDTATVMAEFIHKGFSKESWPFVQFCANDRMAIRSAGNTVLLYKIEDGKMEIAEQIEIPNLALVRVSNMDQQWTHADDLSRRVQFATFVPEKKGKPAQVRIYSAPDHSKVPGGTSHVVSNRSFMRAEEVKIDWSPKGDAILIHTRTMVDTTNKSYYGSSGLHLLQAEADGLACAVPGRKEGPIHDAAWSPDGTVFAVCGGTMPAQTTLYSMKKCEAIFDFGQAHRNTLRFSPSGRFLLIGGFGNLNGTMDFWDVNKKKKMGTNQAHCAVINEWSPDGRYFMTATTTPRMNVDNGIRIYKYNGIGPLLERKGGVAGEEELLFDARWVPVVEGVYPDRPQSPRSIERMKKGIDSAAVATPEKPKAYRPPHSTGKLSELLAAARAGDSTPQEVKVPMSVPGNYVPGMPPKPKESKNAAKHKARREREKKKKQEEETKKIQEEAIKKAAEEKEANSAEGIAKRIRNMKKKLKQIQDLKERQAKGEQLNEDQTKKIGSEEELRRELSSLENKT